MPFIRYLMGSRSLRNSKLKSVQALIYPISKIILINNIQPNSELLQLLKLCFYN